QIAAHEEVIPIAELYHMCKIARKLLDGKHRVGRVIARPFMGPPGHFTRTSRRHDYAVDPPWPMLLDELTSAACRCSASARSTTFTTGAGWTLISPQKPMRMGWKNWWRRRGIVRAG